MPVANHGICPVGCGPFDSLFEHAQPGLRSRNSSQTSGECVSRTPTQEARTTGSAELQIEKTAYHILGCNILAVLTAFVIEVPEALVDGPFPASIA